MSDENPGVRASMPLCVANTLGPGPPGGGRFFAGCDENHEPIGMGLAVYVFERDDARPARPRPRVRLGRARRPRASQPNSRRITIIRATNAIKKDIISPSNASDKTASGVRH